MASLTIRNLPDDVKQRFRERAAAHGRSMEEEARQMIIGAVTNDRPASRKSIGQMLYEASRPGIALPVVHDSQASFASFDE